MSLREAEISHKSKSVKANKGSVVFASIWNKNKVIHAMHIGFCVEVRKVKVPAPFQISSRSFYRVKLNITLRHLIRAIL